MRRKRRYHGAADQETSTTMLTLQWTIARPASRFNVRVRLDPSTITTTTTDENGDGDDDHHQTLPDEQVLQQLQHSLFCAKLFDAMRRELLVVGSATTTTTAWLTPGSSTQPPPNVLVGTQHSGLSPLSVIYIHDGDFQVMLNDEYTLQVQLVESNAAAAESSDAVESPLLSHKNRRPHVETTIANESGSQTPQQLRILGRVLLWQAQETYHRHSIRAEQTWFQKQQQQQQQQQQQPKSAAARTNHPSVVPPVQTKDIVTPPLLTLQTCVSLGAKMLLESRIRTSIRNIQDWLVQSFSETVSERLTVEWLLLPIFDVSAQFVLSFGSRWYLDAHIWCDELTVTRFGDQGDYRKVTFHSDQPFEIYVKTALR